VDFGHLRYTTVPIREQRLHLPQKNPRICCSFSFEHLPARPELRSVTYYVYILRCADAKHYVGYTKDFKDRMARHRRGGVKFTSSRLPFEVLTVIALPDKYKALKLEDYLKTGSGRAFALKHFI
jgi:putative endonuclease